MELLLVQPSTPTVSIRQSTHPFALYRLCSFSPSIQRFEPLQVFRPLIKNQMRKCASSSSVARGGIQLEAALSVW